MVLTLVLPNGNILGMEELRIFLNSLTSAEQIEFALRCKTTISYLRKAISVGTSLKTKLSINIERESKREVTVEQLLPDADWNFIRAAA